MDLGFAGVGIDAADAVVLCRLARETPGAVFAEVGTWAGASAAVLAGAARERGGRLYCVDWWRGNAGTWLEGYAAESDILARFRANMREAGLADAVRVVWSDSVSAAAVMADRAFDLVFLDGDHRYAAVVADIAAWRSKVKLGGILCGHDYAPGVAWAHERRDDEYWAGHHPGVIAAVEEAFGAVACEARVWWVRLGD